jgi:hypothetical protein
MCCSAAAGPRCGTAALGPRLRSGWPTWTDAAAALPDTRLRRAAGDGFYLAPAGLACSPCCCRKLGPRALAWRVLIWAAGACGARRRRAGRSTRRLLSPGCSTRVELPRVPVASATALAAGSYTRAWLDRNVGARAARRSGAGAGAAALWRWRLCSPRRKPRGGQIWYGFARGATLRDAAAGGGGRAAAGALARCLPGLSGAELRPGALHAAHHESLDAGWRLSRLPEGAPATARAGR